MALVLSDVVQGLNTLSLVIENREALLLVFALMTVFVRLGARLCLIQYNKHAFHFRALHYVSSILRFSRSFCAFLHL